MSQNNSFTNINNDQLFLINILNNMYNDNLRQINGLTESNNQIRNTITNILSFRNRGNNNYRRQQNNRSETNNRQFNIDRNFASDSIDNHTYPYLYSSPINSSINSNNNTNDFFQTRNTMNSANEARISASLARQRASQSRNLVNQTMNISNIARNTAYESRNALNTTRLRTGSLNSVRNTTAPINRFLETFLQPVEIYPTPSQVETASRITNYGNILRPVNTSCPISLEPFQDNDIVTVIRYCGHIFNTDEINVWFRSNCRCPVCRYDIRNYNPATYIDTSSNNYPLPASNNLSQSEDIERNIDNEESNLDSTNTTNSQVNTEDMINTLTDTILNSFINNYSPNQNTNINQNQTSPILDERMLNSFTDSSNNSLNYNTLLTTFYYTLPRRTT